MSVDIFNGGDSFSISLKEFSKLKISALSTGQLNLLCVRFRYETAGIAADAAGGVGDRNAAAAAVVPAPRPPRRAG